MLISSRHPCSLKQTSCQLGGNGAVYAGQECEQKWKRAFGPKNSNGSLRNIDSLPELIIPFPSSDSPLFHSIVIILRRTQLMLLHCVKALYSYEHNCVDVKLFTQKMDRKWFGSRNRKCKGFSCQIFWNWFVSSSLQRGQKCQKCRARFCPTFTTAPPFPLILPSYPPFSRLVFQKKKSLLNNPKIMWIIYMGTSRTVTERKEGGIEKSNPFLSHRARLLNMSKKSGAQAKNVRRAKNRFGSRDRTSYWILERV